MAPAGGLWGRVVDVMTLLRHLLPPDLSRCPTAAWQLTGDVPWHNGATRDAAMFVGMDTASGVSVVVHTIGYGPPRTDVLGEQLRADRR